MDKKDRISMMIYEAILVILIVLGVANVIGIFTVEHTWLGIVKLIVEAAIELVLGVGNNWLIKEYGRKKYLRACKSVGETLY